MSEHSAIVSWKRKNSEALTDNQYSRAHIWEFDGGSKILASASPHVVPIPLSVEAHVDPEEAFVAALSSCHMLVFLSIAGSRNGNYCLTNASRRTVNAWRFQSH
ncbi:OsmC-like protein [Vibrio cholerae]|nr:OsmC-like protein [Vibrio cholerae]